MNLPGVIPLPSVSLRHGFLAGARRVGATDAAFHSTAEPRKRPAKLAAVPYAFRANRGEGEMSV